MKMSDKSRSGIAEWFFAFFLFAGYYKVDPRLDFIQKRIDLTILFMVCSMVIFLYRFLTIKKLRAISKTFLLNTLLYLGIALCFLLSAFAVHSVGYGLDKAIRFLTITFWAFLGGGLLISDVVSFRHFLWACTFFSFVMGLDAIFKYPGSGTLIGPVYALGANRIGVGVVTGFGLLINLFYLLPLEQKLFKKIFLWSVALVQGWALFASGSRGPVLAVSLAFAALIVLALRLKSRKIVMHKLTVYAGLGLIIVILTLITFGREYFFTFFTRTEWLIDSVAGENYDIYYASSSRSKLFEEAWTLWKGSPLWGIGSGQYAVALRGKDIIFYPHNIFLELMAEAGLIGIFLFLVMLINAFRELQISSRNGQTSRGPILYFLVQITIFSLVMAMVSFDINGNRHLFMLIGLLSNPRYMFKT